MIVVDANVLIYAVNQDARHHEAARTWLDRALSGGAPVGFCWPVILAFLRITTRSGLFPRPLSIAEATGVVARWLDQPAARILEPGDRHLDRLASQLDSLGLGGNLVNDAHLAALALEHRAEVVTFDRDFGRFDGLRWTIPALPS